MESLLSLPVSEQPMPDYHPTAASLTILLAEVLHERGTIAAPEERTMHPDAPSIWSSVLVDYRGLRVMLDGTLAARDDLEARSTALTAAHRHIATGIAHIVVVLLYPPWFCHPQHTLPTLKATLIANAVPWALVTATHETGFAPAHIADLEAALHRAFVQRIQDDVVQQTVTDIERGVRQFACAVATAATTSDHQQQLERILGMRVQQQPGTASEDGL